MDSDRRAVGLTPVPEAIEEGHGCVFSGRDPARLPPLLILMLPPSLPQVVVPIPSLLAFPFISENATATYVSVS